MMLPMRYRLMTEKIRRTSEEMARTLYERVAPLRAEFARTEEPVPFAEREKLQYVPVAEGDVWSRTLFDCAWFHFTGEAPAGIPEEELYLGIDVDGEGCLFGEDGTPVRGLTNVSTLTEHMLPFQGKRYVPFREGTFRTRPVDVWVDAGSNDMFGTFKGGRLCMAGIYRCDEKRRELLYDYAFLFSLAEGLDGRDPEKMGILYALEEVAVNFSADMPRQKTERLLRVLKPHLLRRGPSRPSLTFFAVGHSHLDLAWLWPLRETRRKAGRTFSTALANLKLYPEYVYGASQPQQFEWVKEDYPALYEKIGAAVAGGRFEVQGGMWVEADTNVTGGESLIRQFYYGKKFWKEEFGKEVNTLWLPDVFGFSGALPQIIRGCGCENFLTIKLSWNMVNAFPYHSFRWKGIDGSEVLVHMPPEGTYNSSAAPDKIIEAGGNYAERGISANAMLLYGVGDGGAGPGREFLEFVRREKDISGMPRVKSATSAEFFAALAKEREKLPEYRGEMYLERHQGTYTSQAENKRCNRLAENRLAELEFACALKGDSGVYERGLDDIWKEVLLYQFHDVLPGSSIRRVYEETGARYRAILARIGEETARVLGGGEKKCALNATSFSRGEYLKCGDVWYRAEAKPWSLTALVPAKGKGSCRARGLRIENGLILAEFSETGELTRLFDKENGREAMCGGNTFRLYDDSFDAWDTYVGYPGSDAQTLRGRRVGYISEGFRAGIVFEYAFGGSLLRQTVTLREGDRALYFGNHISWQETKKMLRVDFRPNVVAEEATFDIQFGSLKRSMKENDSHEWAQYEVCAHKWADISGRGYGVALLNDCKYGYRAKNGVLSMNVLRSQMYPCTDQDKGEHDFAYALLPHAGDAYAGGVAKAAYALNRPLRVVGGEETPSLVATDCEHAVVETVKPAYDGKGIVVRVYNDLPEEIRARVACGGRQCRAADMLENAGEALPDAPLNFRPFEIKTLRFL